MKFENWQLVALLIGTFAAVIALDVFLQYQGNADFKAKFPGMPGAIFAKSRAGEMQAQEMAEPTHPSFPVLVPDEDA
jgi:hypothetical protein